MSEHASRLFLSPPHLSGRELRYVEEAFASNYIAPAGPMLDAFEREFGAYIDVPHTVAVSSGTAAIHLALRLLDLSPGDEVWASTLTFVGSVAPVVQDRLTPVFIDADAKSWTLDPNILEEELALRTVRGKLPKAVIPTDIYGQSCDLDAILRVCNTYEIPIICDSAEAAGARYKDRHAGKGAFATAFSFNGNKILTTSGGGLLASDDKRAIERARYYSTQARAPVPHYEHLEVGFNYRMSNICAAIGRGQLEELNNRVAKKRAIFERYKSLLGMIEGLSFMPEAAYGRSSRWLSVVLIDPIICGVSREDVRLALEAANIESRPVWKPMHLQPVFMSAQAFGGEIAANFFEHGLCLPSGTQMLEPEIVRVVEIILGTLRHPC